MSERGTATPGTQVDPVEWLGLHGDALFRYAMLRVRDRSVAEDLVQECLVAALGARKSFAGKSSERTWLIGILKRKAVDYLRRAARERAGSAEEAVPDLGPFFSAKGLWTANVGNCDLDPAHLSESREFRDVVRQCLESLPQHSADALVLRELDGLSCEEICKVLDITPTNLWTRLHRARLGLRHCLQSNWFRQSE